MNETHVSSVTLEVAGEGQSHLLPANPGFYVIDLVGEDDGERRACLTAIVAWEVNTYGDVESVLTVAGKRDSLDAILMPNGEVRETSFHFASLEDFEDGYGQCLCQTCIAASFPDDEERA